jgi:hypothetical protein
MIPPIYPEDSIAPALTHMLCADSTHAVQSPIVSFSTLELSNLLICSSSPGFPLIFAQFAHSCSFFGIWSFFCCHFGLLPITFPYPRLLRLPYG